MNYKIIAAVCQDRGIGKDGTLPWKIVEDLQFFSKLTKGNGKNAVIMGKKTWDSFKGRSLIERDNLIISSTLSLEDNTNDNKIKSISVEINENFEDQYKSTMKIMKENNFELIQKKHNTDLDNEESKFKNTYNFIFKKR